MWRVFLRWRTGAKTVRLLGDSGSSRELHRYLDILGWSCKPCCYWRWLRCSQCSFSSGRCRCYKRVSLLARFCNRRREHDFLPILYCHLGCCKCRISRETDLGGRNWMANWLVVPLHFIGSCWTFAGGDTNGSAVPSMLNLQSYWSSTGCWLLNSNMDFWWYSPFDALGDSRGGVEQHFGCISALLRRSPLVAFANQTLKIDLKCWDAVFGVSSGLEFHTNVWKELEVVPAWDVSDLTLQVCGWETLLVVERRQWVCKTSCATWI